MEEGTPSASVRRIKRRMVVVVPLTVLGLVLGVMLLNRSVELTPAGDLSASTALPAPIAATVAETAEAAARQISQADHGTTPGPVGCG